MAKNSPFSWKTYTSPSGREGERNPAGISGGVGGDAETVMLTPENIVVLCACVYSASKLLIFATSTQKRILNPFLSLHYRLRVSSFAVSE